MNYKIEFLNENKMVYMRNTGAYGSRKNFDMMKDFKSWIAQNDLTKTLLENGIYGIAQDNPEIIPPEKCRYDLVLITDEDFSQDNKVKTGYFRGGKYAVFTVRHTTEAVQQFWKELPEYIRENDLNICEEPIIERYKEEEGEDKICEFLIPIK